MRSDLAKVLHRAGGRPLLEHVIRACQPVKAAQILAVVGHQAEEVGALAESLGVDTVKQQPQRGTGHALQVARRALRKSAKLVIVRSRRCTAAARGNIDGAAGYAPSRRSSCYRF